MLILGTLRINKKAIMREMDKVVPNLGSKGVFVGRCFVSDTQAYKGIYGPHVVLVKNNEVFDLSEYFSSTAQLINTPNVVSKLLKLEHLKSLGKLDDILENSIFSERKSELPYFVAPNDIQAVKACGVTFIESLLERVIEEKAKGDASKASELRTVIIDKIGEDLSTVTPGSKNAMLLKKELQNQGLWSQYLEVGIGKDAEIFTKSQPLSSVGYGAEVGVLEDSNWNNPEPEVVLAVSKEGRIVGAALGNDVNLRDYEGRSALLLGEAKDQNGSCAIGPLIRLFDDSFTLDTIKKETINLKITGVDGFELIASSPMGKISRAPEKLVAQAIGKNHQYPDGLVLFCGTMFAPTKDRDIPGNGFTHKVGDKVEIFSEHLGTLANWVNDCDKIAPWEWGISSFLEFHTKRSLA